MPAKKTKNKESGAPGSSADKKIIKEPKQRRSIEKKERILKAGIALILEKGYHHTNTAEIAKAAGVSTGIVYRYFSDKKSILIEGILKYSYDLNLRLFANFENLNKENIRSFIRYVLEEILRSHVDSKSAHQEMEALRYFDEDVANIYIAYEERTVEQILPGLLRVFPNLDHPKERIHIIVGMIENFCHEYVFRQRSDLDYAFMKEIIIDDIISTLTIT